MRAWYAEPLAAFLARDPADVVGRLAAESARRHAGDQARQIDAWTDSIALLRTALAESPPEWMLALEFDLLRLEKRIDAVLLTDRAILVLEFKLGARGFEAADLRQVEDYALDLHDFHAGSRAHPVVPVLVATEAPAPAFDPPLFWHGVTPVLRANASSLAELIGCVQRSVAAPRAPLDHTSWHGAPYRPVPSIIEAASTLFARNSVGDIAAARADTANLTRTTAAILRAIDAAARDRARVVVFVTGIPGAGKTLCGMNVVFGTARHAGAAFLTGNAPLVAVLREALARNAAADRSGLKEARRRTRSALQNVHRFLEDNALDPGKLPNERVIVFDEAQRAWNEAKALAGTQNKKSRLTMSEPAHTLEILGRHGGWTAVVALIGNGQEINTGEAGLAEWGRVIAASGGAWRAVAAPRAIAAPVPAQRLTEGPTPWLTMDPELDLTVPIRSVRGGTGAAWVEAVLAGDAAEAARLAAKADDDLPFLLTRELVSMRDGLRARVRGLRRAGLVASSGAKRLRAEGLGAQLIGADATVQWFLERWPDVRGSDALEVFATEYACQGLELDLVGMAWGGDFSRGRDGWLVRDFVGSLWQAVNGALARSFVLNTYRVLLTRARYETIIWVPPGDDADRTRPRAEMDAIADFLLACGVRKLEPPSTAEQQSVRLF
jgi:hypothetical protein